MSTVKAFFLIFLGFVAPIYQAQAGTALKVYLTTGGDDLRAGNNAFITINFTNGSTLPEYVLGGGFANGSLNTKTINIPPTVTNVSEIASITIRHDGSPRAGQPFDTYDNWDLSKLRVTFNIGGVEHDWINTPVLVRFTGALRTKSFLPTNTLPSPSSNKLKVYLTTGSDDLRGGNNAFMTIKYVNGTSSPEYLLGGGFGQNSLTTKTVTIERALSDVAEIQSITIRHDGSPRAGQPFDTYDNWDLQGIRVAFIFPSIGERNIIDPIPATPLVRFTGSLRAKTFVR